MLQHALAYGRLGWSIFPVAADCRVPIKVDGWFEHGVADATADASEIERRWTRFPRANIAVACKASGILALDIDRKGEVDGFAGLAKLEAEFEPLPATITSETPSGGQHRLFRYPLGVDPPNRVGIKRYSADGSRRVYPGLDVRGQNASIALAPSQKAAGRYRWVIGPDDLPAASLPRWLLQLMLSEPPRREQARPMRFSSTDKAARYVTAAVDRECSDLATMGPNTGRNARLFQAAANLGELVGAGMMPQSMAEDALEAAAHENGLVREDGLHSVRASIKSGLTRGISKPREVTFS